MGNPVVAGGPDHVLMVNHDLRHRAIARDKHQRVDIAQRGAKSLRVGIVGGSRADARWPPPGQQPATGQCDDLVLLLSGHQPYDLASDPSAGAGHRDAQHALLQAGAQDLDGCMRPECPVRAQQQRRPQPPRGSAEQRVGDCNFKLTAPAPGAGTDNHSGAGPPAEAPVRGVRCRAWVSAAPAAMTAAPAGSFQVSRSPRMAIPARTETSGMRYPTVVAIVAPATAMM